jgi:ferredoxin
VLCVPSSAPNPSQGQATLPERLQAKGAAVLQCNEDLPVKNPESVTAFISRNKLETVLIISNLSKTSVTEALRYSAEKAGLRRLAISYLDIRLLEEGNGSQLGNDSGLLVVLSNLARLEHADLIKDAVLKTVIGHAKISRRELFRSVPKVLKTESDVPITLQTQCNQRSASCTYCKDACPVNAISLTPDSVVIDDRLCIECGACARECPIGAIQGPSVSDNQIMAMLNAVSGEHVPSKRLLLLSCPLGLEKLASEVGEQRTLDPSVVPVLIPCVGSVGSVHYVWAASQGVSFLTVCPDISCKKAEAAVRLYRHVASAKNLLRASADNGADSVNHLTLNAKESMLDSISRIAESTSPTDASTKLVGVYRRELLLDAVRRLATNYGSGMIRLPPDHTLPFFDMEVDGDRCTYCELCQKNCPDHAIEFTKGQGVERFVFDPALCSGCVICEENCPMEAIHVSRLVELSPILRGIKAEKASDLEAKCERCGTVLGTKGSLAVLKQKLLEQGASDAMLKALSLCNRCKAQSVFHPREKRPILMKDFVA